MPSFCSSISEVAARPITTSALGFAFSARSFAVMMPVESRTQRMSMPGLPFSNSAL